jgi:hypothetical protein
MPWEGMDELRTALRQLPEELTAEGATIVYDTADAAAAAIVAAYPSVSGKLKQGVRVRQNHYSRFGVQATVVNTAKIAWIFEHGTEARHTALGANRGRMPVGKVFVPNMERYRRDMYDQKFRALLERHGLTVTVE